MHELANTDGSCPKVHFDKVMNLIKFFSTCVCYWSSWRTGDIQINNLLTPWQLMGFVFISGGFLVVFYHLLEELEAHICNNMKMILNGFCKLCTLHTPKINLIYSILPWFFCTSFPSKKRGDQQFNILIENKTILRFLSTRE